MKWEAVRRELARREASGADGWLPGHDTGTTRTWCHRKRSDFEVSFQTAGPGRWRVIGLKKCRSLTECPLCARGEGAKRAEQIRKVVRRWEHDLGGKTYLLTLTVPHGAGDDIKAQLVALAKAWSEVWRNREGRLARNRYELEWWVRAFDVTHGEEHGWHPHLHALLGVRRPLDLHQTTRDDGATIYDGEPMRWLRDRWHAVCAKRGLPAGLWGIDVRLEPIREAGKATVALPRYLMKMGVAPELASHATKHAKRSNRTTLQLLAASMAGDEQAGRRWDEWCEAVRGTRWLTWSKGAQRRFGGEVAQPALPCCEQHQAEPEWLTVKTYYESEWDWSEQTDRNGKPRRVNFRDVARRWEAVEELASNEPNRLDELPRLDQVADLGYTLEHDAQLVQPDEGVDNFADVDGVDLGLDIAELHGLTPDVANHLPFPSASTHDMSAGSEAQ